MSDSGVWVPFSEDSVFDGNVDDSTLGQLETLWRQAMAEIGFPCPSERAFFRRSHGIAQLDLGHFVSVLSNSSLTVIEERNGRYRVQSAGSWVRATASLLKIHWRLESLLSVSIDKISSSQIRSLALGICFQILLMRLPAHTPQQLAAWALAPERAPRGVRRTVRLLLELQKRRQALSGSWKDFFPSAVPGPEAPPLLKSQSEPTSERTWQGLAVTAGRIEGRYFLSDRNVGESGTDSRDSTILIFAKARPESVELYPHATAVLFAEGGIFSHACCIARERGLPCITALGPDFLAWCRAHPSGRLRLETDPASGTGKVTFLSLD